MELYIRDGTRYLTLFRTKKYEDIYDIIRYLISLKSSVKYIFPHDVGKIKVYSYDSLHIEKIVTLPSVMKHIKAVSYKDKC